MLDALLLIAIGLFFIEVGMRYLEAIDDMVVRINGRQDMLEAYEKENNRYS